MKAERFTEALGVILVEIEQRLQRVGGKGVALRDELSNEGVGVLPATPLALPGDLTSVPRRAPALPRHRAALVLPPFPHITLVTALDLSSGEPADFVPTIWWIACVRAQISPQERADLHTFVFVEENEHSAEQWRNQIERDDRFCRKLVWIVPPLNADMRCSAQRFLDRSFLAQPWADDAQATARGLDPLTDLAESVARDVDFPERTIRAWLGLLGRGNVIGRDLAEEMVRIAEGSDDS